MEVVSMRSELWQAYSEQGEPIKGSGLTKAQARSGVLHGAVHLWIWRRRPERLEILLQKRAADKPTWPGAFDISAAGHIDLGEQPLRTVMRETEEEVGFKPDVSKLRLLFVHHALLTSDPDIIENEFQWVYGLELTDEVNFVLQAEEVELTVWLALGEFKRLIAGDLPGGKIVPHGDIYFNSLLDAIAQAN